MLDLCLSNCKIVPENIEYSIGINEGKIVSIKRSTIKAEKTIDINGKIVLPGLIDAHVHMRDPGFTYKEDFRSGTSCCCWRWFYNCPGHAQYKTSNKHCQSIQEQN